MANRFLKRSAEGEDSSLRVGEGGEEAEVDTDGLLERKRRTAEYKKPEEEKPYKEGGEEDPMKAGEEMIEEGVEMEEEGLMMEEEGLVMEEMGLEMEEMAFDEEMEDMMEPIL